MNTTKEWWQTENRNPTLELMHVFGWQGGTIHQVCQKLNCKIEDILYRGKEKFEEMLSKACRIKSEGF